MPRKGRRYHQLRQSKHHIADTARQPPRSLCGLCRSHDLPGSGLYGSDQHCQPRRRELAGHRLCPEGDAQHHGPADTVVNPAGSSALAEVIAGDLQISGAGGLIVNLANAAPSAAAASTLSTNNNLPAMAQRRPRPRGTPGRQPATRSLWRTAIAIRRNSPTRRPNPSRCPLRRPRTELKLRAERNC